MKRLYGNTSLFVFIFSVISYSKGNYTQAIEDYSMALGETGEKDKTKVKAIKEAVNETMNSKAENNLNFYQLYYLRGHLKNKTGDINGGFSDIRKASKYNLTADILLEGALTLELQGDTFGVGDWYRDFLRVEQQSPHPRDYIIQRIKNLSLPRNAYNNGREPLTKDEFYSLTPLKWTDLNIGSRIFLW